MKSTLLYGANINANGIRQHYLRYGGPQATHDAIVLIPGITSPAITWGFVAETLGRHFDTYVLDVRGRGLSEASSTLDYSLDAQTADLIAFIEAIGLKQANVLGHSMGARIALRAARQTKSIARLALIDPPVSGPGRRAYPAQLAWYIDSIALARKGIDVEGMRAFCPTWTDEQLRLRAQWLHTCDERAIRASFEGFHTDDIHADMPHVTQPTLLMSAGRGDVIRDEDIAEMRDLMPQLEVVKVPNAGHMIPWDDEQGFYRALGSFFGATLT
ncbi:MULTISPECIES: alpha/beta hydrolase [Caballeronia]|jgi:N-formylmaleamate deformylase|uniref:Alpha/beta hydrolase n=1 Tax=Caballeronia zhejiangensis TaxID=871203 RepID=A0A656Q9Y5_9BURK|nr:MULTISPECIES: alpha/beta hydrolase [Caballeronia]EKS70536.1 Alpha/beta hydrolase [Burkholderia sp. SJ98]KDR24741.1 alpha/beta hydrolase [Caballeronia zhejiangensis]MDR5767983.1 alpha/beta hydrolase [Caballeronia sp. LZ028]MDR5791058.1 alpha/beta hydrolase [Caballeronia sp. LP003]